MTLNGSGDAIAVIPARFASTRFPGKVLADIAGLPLVAHTYNRAIQSKHVSSAVVATDDDRVVEALKPHGIPTIMTRADHQSGTDRMAEVARSHAAEIYINVQGDEPLIDPGAIDACIEALLADPGVPVATARRPLVMEEQIRDPNIVKVVTGVNGRALYFSRSVIPHIRDERGDWRPFHNHWQHIGLYAFRRDFLMAYSALEATPLEQLEKLEQLRILENGHPILVVDTEYVSIGVDVPEDLERVRKLISQGGVTE